MQTTTHSILGLLATLALVQSLYAQSPIPNDASQKTAAGVVIEVYKADFQSAKTSEQKIALAKKLMLEGAATKDDPTGKFALIRIARDMATQQGDLATAFQAIDQLADAYLIDNIQMKADAAGKAVKALRIPKAHAETLPLFGKLIDEALTADRYEVAQTVCGLAISSAREAHDTVSLKRFTSYSNHIVEVERQATKVKASLAVLETKPTDTEANFAVGWFEGPVKGNWSKSIPMLALGHEPITKALAMKELVEQPNALEIGDSWWDFAESKPSPVKERIQVHAAQWYRQAMPTLTGLTKAKIEQRLASVPMLNSAQELKVSKEPSGKQGKLANLQSNTLKMQFVLIPSGEFQMGSSEKEEGRATDEPKHKVKITKPFYIGQHEVTVGQFRAFLNAEGYKTDAEKSGQKTPVAEVTAKADGKPFDWQNPGFKQTDHHPAAVISWNDAVAFCKWLSDRESKCIGYRRKLSGNMHAGQGAPLVIILAMMRRTSQQWEMS